MIFFFKIKKEKTLNLKEKKYIQIGFACLNRTREISM